MRNTVIICKPAHVPFVLLLAMIAFRPAGAEGPDAARGRVLYNQHCSACHTPGIHGRTTGLPITRAELRMLVDTFRRQAGLGWTREEIDDMVEHLNTMVYRFRSEEKRPKAL
jgi:mono/diheme cytochrome c family protein